MNEFEGEGVAIALLIGADDGNCVGWVYRWPEGPLTVLWDIEGPKAVSRTEPELGVEDLEAIGFDHLQRITREKKK